MATRSSSSRRRKRRRGDGLVWKLLVPAGLLVVIVVVAVVLLRPSSPTAIPTKPACPQVADVVVGAVSVPSGPIEGYCQTALVNAAQIIAASRSYTESEHAMDIGVMVAIGESNLQNLTYGDTAGPDSRGIFQQRSNWGTLAQRMDPFTAAFDFYHRMFGVVGWDTLPPTQVAHIVQGNANPDYYTPYFPRAQAIVAALLADQLPPPMTASPTPIPTPPAKP